MNLCDYCKQPRDSASGWHDCPQAQEAKCRLAASVDGIKAMMERPGIRPLTSNGLKVREDARHHMAGALTIKGLPVRSEYTYDECND